MHRISEMLGTTTRPEQITQRRRVQTVIEFLVVGVCTLAFALTAVGICVSLLNPNGRKGNDFLEYWASGQQLAHHGNPYDPVAILNLEHSGGRASTLPALVMGNAPISLVLVYPLGYLSAESGWLLWSLLLLCCLTISVRLIRILHGSPMNNLHLLGYTFGPALVCLLAGQTSLFVLLGLVLFLRFRVSSPFFAGIALWLCMLKPHLFLPFGVVLLAWAIVTRGYRILAGIAAALGTSAVAVSILDRAVWGQYERMMSIERYDLLPIPCLSILLRRGVSPNTVWLQYLPAVLGCVWALVYFHRHRHDWDWIEHGSPLMLVSVLVAPYTWLLDQTIVLPAVLHAVYVTRSRSAIAILGLMSAVMEIGALRGLQLTLSSFYLWTAPAWLAWYFYALSADSERTRTAAGT